MYPGGARFGVQLSFDVEMVTNFPYWGNDWNARKGALDRETKEYIRRISETCSQYGAKAHYFLVGSLFEDPDVDFLKASLDAGHSVGNHTYTHVSIKAKQLAHLAGVYAYEPWRAAGRTAPEIVREEVQMTTDAIRRRLGVSPRGFRSPGGFVDGLQNAPEVRRMLAEEGFWWVSTHYNDGIQRHASSPVGRSVTRKRPLDELVAAFNASERHLQPYRYADGLFELPLAGITDVVAWRWYGTELGDWVRLLEAGVDYAHENGLIFMLTTHPAVLAAVDPECLTLHAVLSRAREKEGGVWLPDLEEVAEWVRDVFRKDAGRVRTVHDDAPTAAPAV